MAFAAGIAAVLAAWEGVAAVDGRTSLRALERVLAPLRAGRAPTAAEQRRIVLVGAATLAAAGWLAGGIAGAILAGAAGPAAVRQALAARTRRRRARLAAAAPAVARALADALAGGHAVHGAIVAAARGGGLTGPAGEALRDAAAALELGEPVEDVLEAVRARARALAWDTLTAAILLQRDAGGDLAGLLRELAERLEQARRDDAEAQTATAQARFTAWLVAALPAGAGVLAELASPGYLASLAGAPLTAALAVASIVLQVAAVVVIRRIARS
jgi:tight adherence protein B